MEHKLAVRGAMGVQVLVSNGTRCASGVRRNHLNYMTPNLHHIQMQGISDLNRNLVKIRKKVLKKLLKIQLASERLLSSIEILMHKHWERSFKKKIVYLIKASTISISALANGRY
jgi:hypothetical protein